MKNGILIIALVWLLLNFLSWLLFGIDGALISTYSCMFIIWFGRKKLSKLLKILKQKI